VFHSCFSHLFFVRSWLVFVILLPLLFVRSWLIVVIFIYLSFVCQELVVVFSIVRQELTSFQMFLTFFIYYCCMSLCACMLVYVFVHCAFAPLGGWTLL
jgi:hypothetical protein